MPHRRAMPARRGARPKRLELSAHEDVAQAPVTPSLRDDFTRRAVVRPGDEPWVWSPNREVQRLRLDRIGAEVARATSIVRYPPDSRFPTHTHGGGEEILVLDGVFSDASGHYETGAYVRNPPGSAHAPYSEGGCLLFVKLWQFAPDDDARIVIDTRHARWRAGGTRGTETLPLHAHRGVRTALRRWGAGASPGREPAPGGAEIYVLDGSLEDASGEYAAGTWLRQPPGSELALRAGAGGARFYIKTGGLLADSIPLPDGPSPG